MWGEEAKEVESHSETLSEGGAINPNHHHYTSSSVITGPDPLAEEQLSISITNEKDVHDNFCQRPFQINHFCTF